MARLECHIHLFTDYFTPEMEHDSTAVIATGIGKAAVPDPIEILQTSATQLIVTMLIKHITPILVFYEIFSSEAVEVFSKRKPGSHSFTFFKLL